jgi:SAM-dependent methyltransferase
MAYYDRIAKSWHEATGYSGGSFKRYVLNDILLERMSVIAGRSVLELGAGNGYFIRLALERFSGQIPERVVITDGSARLLSIAQTHFPIASAEYMQLDVRSRYPFEEASFDLILATMVFNEVSTGGLRRAFLECRRVLHANGLLLMTITHPDFVASLDRRQQLRRNRDGILTMPGPGQLRLPIVPRRVRDYERLLAKAGFAWQKSAVKMTKTVVREKPGLRRIGEDLVSFLRSGQTSGASSGNFGLPVVRSRLINGWA